MTILIRIKCFFKLIFQVNNSVATFTQLLFHHLVKLETLDSILIILFMYFQESSFKT